MKPSNAAVCVLLCLVMAACDPVSFREPQPAGAGAIDEFPSRLHGSYLSSDRTQELRITGPRIISVIDYDYAAHKDSLRGYEVHGNFLTDTAGNTEPVRHEGDSVIRHVHYLDTFFQIGDKGVLKKFRGSYFLNSRTDKDAWVVSRITLEKGMLTIGSITDSSEISRLQAITEAPADTAGYVFQPTRKQFRAFVREEGFRSRDTFYRISKQ